MFLLLNKHVPIIIHPFVFLKCNLLPIMCVAHKSVKKQQHPFEKYIRCTARVVYSIRNACAAADPSLNRFASPLHSAFSKIHYCHGKLVYLE